MKVENDATKISIKNRSIKDNNKDKMDEDDIGHVITDQSLGNDGSKKRKRKKKNKKKKNKKRQNSQIFVSSDNSMEVSESLIEEQSNVKSSLDPPIKVRKRSLSEEHHRTIFDEKLIELSTKNENQTCSNGEILSKESNEPTIKCDPQTSKNTKVLSKRDQIVRTRKSLPVFKFKSQICRLVSENAVVLVVAETVCRTLDIHLTIKNYFPFEFFN